MTAKGHDDPNLPPAVRPVPEYEEFLERGDEPAPKSHTQFWVVFFFAACGYISLFFHGDTSWRFAVNGLQSLPFLLLAILAYLGERNPDARIPAFVYWLLLMCVLAGGIGLMAFGAVARPELFDKTRQTPFRPQSLGDWFLPGGQLQLALVILWLFAIGLFSLSLYSRPMRRTAAGLLPMYADSFVHVVALATVVGLTAMLFVPLVVIGEPPLLLFLTHLEGKPIVEDMSKSDQFFDTLSSFVWLVPCAILAVGFPFERSLGESLERVGLVRPSILQVVFGLVAALALVGLMIGVDFVITWLWQVMGWRTTDAKKFEELMKFAINPIGAVIVGVTAGLGEELFARGVLQPRLGILLSNLLFTAMHALQYNWDGLTSVFLIGMLLGWIRKKTNTTTSAIVHGTYDFVLIMIAYWWPTF